MSASRYDINVTHNPCDTVPVTFLVDSQNHRSIQGSTGYTNDTVKEYYAEMPATYRDVQSLELVRAVIPARPLFDTSSNTVVLQFDDGAGGSINTKSITIASGFYYTISDLATAIQTALNTYTAATIGTFRVTGSLSQILTIVQTASGTGATTRFLAVIYSGTTIAGIIGLTGNVTASALSATLQTSVLLNPIYIVMRIRDSAHATGNGTELASHFCGLFIDRTSNCYFHNRFGGKPDDTFTKYYVEPTKLNRLDISFTTNNTALAAYNYIDQHVLQFEMRLLNRAHKNICDSKPNPMGLGMSSVGSLGPMREDPYRL